MKRYTTTTLLFLAGITFFSSCKIGKEYSRPELDLPESIAGKPVTDNLTVADIQWTEIYTDTVLQGLIRTTLAYNKDLLAAAARVKESRFAHRVEKSKLFPQVSADALGEREYDRSPGNTYNVEAVLSWELDLWGKLRWGSQAGLAAYLQTVEGQRAMRMTLVARVAQAYFELQALDMELSIVRQTYDARAESVRLAKLRFEGGLTSETAYRQAEVELAKTRTLIPDLERKIRLKENDISLLTGDYPGNIPRGKNINEQTLPAELPVGLPSSLLERRPDLRQAEYKLKAANAKVGIAYTSMFPQLTLTARYGLEDKQLDDFLSAPYFYVGGKLLAPLLNAGNNRAKLRASRAALEAATYNYQQTVLTAFKEVDNALTTFYKIREIRESRSRLEQAARSYMELANLQYINGVISYLDVLDAQRGYFDAQINLNNAVRDELISVVNLYSALGGGWVTDPSTSPNHETSCGNPPLSPPTVSGKPGTTRASGKGASGDRHT